jgi:geranylgeranyl pyrophosphate synthase
MLNIQSLSKLFFSSAKSKSTNPVLHKYIGLLEKSNYMKEEIFPKKINNSSEFMQFFEIEKISNNVKIEGNVSVESTNDGLFTPCWDLMNRGGKLWRPSIGLMVAKYFNINIDDVDNNKLLYKLTSLSELTHNASLIIDDVMDKSDFRRHLPSIHKKFGEDVAINAGISMYYIPMYKVLNSIKDPEMKINLTNSYLEEIISLQLGQGWDIEMNGKNRTPSVQNYIEIAMFKTGVCPRFTVKLIKTLINNKNYDDIFKDFLDIADYLSVAFQIKDDLLNISPSILSQGKGFLGEDIYTGKHTLMVIHTLSSEKPNSNKERLREIIFMNTKDEKLIREAIDILFNNGSIEFAEGIMNKYADMVKEKCEKLAKLSNFNTEGVNDLQLLMNYLIDRNV